MKTDGSMKEIKSIHQKCGDPAFLMAIYHLFDMGHSKLSKSAIESAKKKIRKNMVGNSVLSPDFQCELLDTAQKLSAFPIGKLLLYCKLYVPMKGDDLKKLEDADQALTTWDSLSVPLEWKALISDPDLREAVLRNIVENHSSEYSDQEITDAVRQIARME